MMGDKKKMAAAIVAKMDPPEKPVPEEAEEVVDDGEGLAHEGLLASAGDILAAIEAKDAQGLAAAFKSLIEQCE